jgi:hypothetical protein
MAIVRKGFTYDEINVGDFAEFTKTLTEGYSNGIDAIFS